MTPEQSTTLTRRIWAQRARQGFWPFFIVIGFLALLLVKNLNLVMSTSEDSCMLVRWTEQQSATAPRNRIVYCDMQDGTTIMALADMNWIPPQPGSRLKLQVQRLLFGTRYRVVN